MVVGGACRIGVLGGIGPEATVEFYKKLIKKLQKKGLIKSNRDFPQIIINSIPAPELIYAKISDKELQPYVHGLKELDKFKVDFIVMVCNTIHLYYDKLQKEINTPLLDLREEVKRTVGNKGIKSTLILGTPNMISQDLYKFKDVKSFTPNKTEINQLSGAIFNFNIGIEKEKQVQKVRSICETYMKKGAETVILGCTEFSIMLGKENFSKINTIDVLVDATIKKLYKQ